MIFYRLEKCSSIDIPDDDPVFEDCMPLSRSQWVADDNGNVYFLFLLVWNYLVDIGYEQVF